MTGRVNFELVSVQFEGVSATNMNSMSMPETATLVFADGSTCTEKLSIFPGGQSAWRDVLMLDDSL